MYSEIVKVQLIKNSKKYNMAIKETLKKVLKRRDKGLSHISNIEKELINEQAVCQNLLSFNSNPVLLEIIKEQRREQEWNEAVTAATKLSEKITEFCSSNTPNKKSNLSIAKDRTGRPYINVGIIAPFRNGKSTLLKNLFGWTDEDKDYIIPTDDSRSDACTATSISYVNELYNNEGIKCDNYAVVYYYSEEEMVELIKQECNVLGIELTEEYNNLEGLINLVKEKTKNKKYALQEQALMGYISGYSEFANVIDNNKSYDKFDLSKEEDKKRFYRSVCYWTEPDKKKRKRSNFARISKCATVFKTLIIEGIDPGPIRFMDTPGLGEYRSNVGDNLAKTLRRDVDIAIALCKTSEFKVKDLEQFNQYIKKDFYITCNIDDQEFSTKECLYYVVNYDTKSEQKDVDEVFSKIDESLTNSSIVDGKTINGVELLDDHIKMIDCENNRMYDYEKTKDGIRFDEEEFNDNGIERFLRNTLEELCHTIDKIDEHFISESLSSYKSIREEYNKLINLVNHVGSLEIDLTAEKNRKIQSIQKGLCIHPTYKEEVSYTNFDEKILQIGPVGLVQEFLYGQGVEKDLIVRENDYGALCEFQVYEKMKIKFRNFFIEKLKECFNTESMKQAAEETQREIGTLMINSGLAKLSEDVICYRPEKWIEMFNDLHKDKFCNIARVLKEMTCVNQVDDVISNYVKIDMKACFHAEKSHSQESQSTMFEDLSGTNNTLYLWLVDIAESLIEHTENGKDGSQSFVHLIENAKSAYNESCNELYRSIQFGGDAYDDLERIIINFKDSVFDDLKDKVEASKEWNILYEDINK